MLRDFGYEVVEEQPAIQVPVLVDGQARSYGIRADFFVERVEDGSRFVAEVKTGRRAPDPLYGATRRQLLEYLVAYDVEGVLLVDMEAGEVFEVSWPDLTVGQVGDDVDRRGNPIGFRWGDVLLAGAFGAAGGALLTLLFLR